MIFHRQEDLLQPLTQHTCSKLRHSIEINMAMSFWWVVAGNLMVGSRP